MKKYFYMLAAALAMTACNSDEPTLAPVVTDNDFESPDGQVVIQLGGVNPYAETNTRAPLTELTETNVDFGIYALATSEDGTATTNATAWADTQNSGILLNNVKGEISSWADKSADNGIVATDVQKISLYDAAGTTKGKVYYYPMQKKYEYTFYGYAPYQNDATVSAANTSVTFPEFNGHEDIIWQKAAANPVAKNDIYVTKDNQGSPVKGESGNIYGYKAQYIRMLKYHHELENYAKDPETGVAKYPWIPNLSFQHKLAQLRFSIIAAKDQSKEDKADAQKIKVTDIKIVSHGKTPKLDILTGNLTFTDTKALSMLQVTSGTTYTDQSAAAVQYTPQYDATNSQDIANPTVDGYMMVQSTDGLTIPSGKTSVYELQLTLTAPEINGATGEPATQTVTIPLVPPTPKEDSGYTAKEFYPGMFYNIRIGIYAMQEVVVTATLADWVAGSDDDIYAPVE